MRPLAGFSNGAGGTRILAAINCRRLALLTMTCALLVAWSDRPGCCEQMDPIDPVKKKRTSVNKLRQELIRPECSFPPASCPAEPRHSSTGEALSPQQKLLQRARTEPCIALGSIEYVGWSNLPQLQRNIYHSLGKEVAMRVKKSINCDCGPGDFLWFLSHGGENLWLSSGMVDFVIGQETMVLLDRVRDDPSWFFVRGEGYVYPVRAGKVRGMDLAELWPKLEELKRQRSLPVLSREADLIVIGVTEAVADVHFPHVDYERHPVLFRVQNLMMPSVWFSKARIGIEKMLKGNTETDAVTAWTFAGQLHFMGIDSASPRKNEKVICFLERDLAGHYIFLEGSAGKLVVRDGVVHLLNQPVDDTVSEILSLVEDLE
jgi:hypothetical protein